MFKRPSARTEACRPFRILVLAQYTANGQKHKKTDLAVYGSWMEPVSQITEMILLKDRGSGITTHDPVLEGLAQRCAT